MRTPSAKPIPYARQDVSEADIAAVAQVLRSDFLTQGPAIAEFEHEVAGYCGVRYAIAVSSATAGLHLACLAAGLEKGKTLWTSPNTFVASANCALYCGADVDFVDIDPATLNLSVPELERKLERARESNTLPSAVVPVHFAGQPCEMAEIAKLAEKYGFRVIEDAAHAIGGEYRGSKIGSCEYSDLTVLSFHPVKIITSAEGGMVLTNRRDYYEKLLRLRTHGITREPALLSEPDRGPWYYEQIELGYHYRLTDIQAALGRSQLGRIDSFVEKRRALADRYASALAHLPIRFQAPSAHGKSALHLFPIQIDESKSKRDRKAVFLGMRDSGIGVNVHYIPVHLQPYYRARGFKAGQFPNAEAYYDQAISLPMFASLTHPDQDRVVESLNGLLR